MYNTDDLTKQISSQCDTDDVIPQKDSVSKIIDEQSYLMINQSHDRKILHACRYDDFRFCLEHLDASYDLMLIDKISNEALIHDLLSDIMTEVTNSINSTMKMNTDSESQEIGKL